jgi:multiple sugar transport system permease protein
VSKWIVQKIGGEFSMRKNRIVPYTMLAPFILLFLSFFIFPIIYSFYISLHVTQMGQEIFVGLSNYVTAIGDNQFWSSITTILVYAVVQACTALLIGLALALLLDSSLVRGKSFFRFAYFLPYAVPGVIATVMWGFLYSPKMNPMMKAIFIFNGGHSFNILSADNLIYLITNIVTWAGAGYFMTLYIAALTSLPTEMYEAAKIDGCNEFQIALRIKLPLLKPMILLTSMLSIIGSFQLFNEPFLLQNLADVPQAYTPNLYIYKMAFNYGNFDYSATLSFLLAFVTLIVSVIFFYATSGKQRRERRKQSKGISQPNPALRAAVQESEVL